MLKILQGCAVASPADRVGAVLGFIPRSSGCCGHGAAFLASSAWWMHTPRALTKGRPVLGTPLCFTSPCLELGIRHTQPVSSLLCAPSILAEFDCLDPLGSACSSGSTLHAGRGCSNVELCSLFPVIRGAAVCGGQTKFNAAFWSVNSQRGHQERDKLHPDSAQRCSVPNRGFTACCFGLVVNWSRNDWEAAGFASPDRLQLIF